MGLYGVPLIEDKMRLLNKFPLALVFIFLNFSVITAQWNLKISTEQEINDNPFHTNTPLNSLMSSVELDVEKNLGQLSLGYYGSYLNFNVIPERNFYWHQVALWKEFENSSLGAYFEQRLGRDIYTYYNFNNYTLYYNSQLEAGPFHVFLNPNIIATTYENISILNNLKANLGLGINTSFESGTTVIVGGSLNHKIYLNPRQTGTYTYLDPNNNLTEETYMDRNVSSITQLVSYGRIAQSITTSTGFAFQYTNRSIFTRVGSFVKELNLYYGDESEMFDDPVNYEGNNLAFELTQILFDDLEIKAGYYMNNKNYITQGVYNELYDYNTSVMRSDIQNILNLSMKKNISLGDSDNLNLFLGLSYQIIKNSSNSYLYNYKSNSVSFNVGIEF